jgi:formate hydrogenlyase subunit 6/NADH:ubiquinone oxidoreductase subunit I
MFDFLEVVIKNAFHRPATRNYPKTVREPYPGQKGHIVIDIPKCIYCGMCMRKCPTHAIEVKRADRTWAINRFRCIMCAACTETCPKKCLSMDGHYTPPAQTKSVDIFRGRKPLQNLQLPQQSLPAAAAAAKPAAAAAQAQPGAGTAVNFGEYCRGLCANGDVKGA